MLTIRIEMSAHTMDDVEEALERLADLLREGHTSGEDDGEGATVKFDVQGEEEL